jgi:hypothetical protein
MSSFHVLLPANGEILRAVVPKKTDEGGKMNLAGRIAWRNLWRHPQRTALMIAIVAFGSERKGQAFIFESSWQWPLASR